MPETPETLALIKRYQTTRDPRAIAALIKANETWLQKETRSAARRQSIDFDIAYQAALIGFAQSVERYDAGQGSSLRGYAKAAWMRHAFAEASAEHHLSPVLPSTSIYWQGRLLVLRRATAALRDAGEPVTDASIAAKLGWGTETVRDTRLAANCISMDAPLGEDGESTLADLLPSKAKSPHQLTVEKLDGAKVMDAVESVLDGIEDREVDIFRRRFLGGETLEEIGNSYGITKERVRQLEARVVDRMRESLAEDPRVVGFLD